MSRMADTVQKNNDAEKMLERRVVQYQIEKEAKDQENEDKKKEEVRRKLSEIKKTLDIQVSEKRVAKEHENYVNDDYMKKWMQIAEDDNARRKEKEN